MRQHQSRDSGCVLGLHSCQPPDLGDREGGKRHASDGSGPCSRPAELADQIAGVRGRAGVGPQQGRTDDLVLLVQHHHAVLLPSHGHRLNSVKDSVQGGVQCLPPDSRIDLRAVGMRMPCLAHEFTGLCVTYDDLD